MTDVLGPRTSPNFEKQVAHDVLAPLNLLISGEFTNSVYGSVVGAARFAGKVVNVWWSVGACGRDDDNQLSGEVDVKINGTTCLSTKPSIRYVSGETSQQKTTKVTGDTGITKGVVNSSNAAFEAGDIFTVDLVLVSQSSPDVKMGSAVVVVELEPD